MAQLDNGDQQSQEQSLPLLKVPEAKELAALGIVGSAPPAHTPVNVFLTDGTGLQSLADAASKWRRELRLMVVWCITSVVALLSGGILSLSAVSAVIGVACSLRFLCRINQPTPARDIAASVKATFWLAIVAAVLSGLWMICSLILSIVIFSIPNDKNSLPSAVVGLIFLIPTASLLAHTVTSSFVAHRARFINRQMSTSSILV